MIVHPSLTLLSTPFDREALFLTVFCLVDDWMKARFHNSSAPRSHRGPRQDEFADSETLAVLIVGSLCHCQKERAWLRQVRANHRALFPHLPEDSRFHRRAQRVRFLLGDLRRTVLFWADADLEPLRILDTFPLPLTYPLPLCANYRIAQSALPVQSAAFGYNVSKRSFYFGLRPGLLSTASGYIEDIILSHRGHHPLARQLQRHPVFGALPR